MLALSSVGWLQKTDWLASFLSAGNRKLFDAFGLGPGLWGVGGALCRFNLTCISIVGGVLSTSILVVTLFVILSRRRWLSQLVVVAIVIPAALLVTPYAWAYDQILLVVPIAVAIKTLMQRGAPFLVGGLTFLFIAVLGWALLVLAAVVEHDAWSAIIPFGAWVLALWCSTKETRSLSKPPDQSKREGRPSSA